MIPTPQSLRRLGEKNCDGIAYVLALSLGLVAAIVPYCFNHRFYFYNDEETYCYPYYIDIGRYLREGHWPLLSLDTFCGGNFSIDWELALFNPVSLFCDWLMAPARNLELTSLCFAGFHITMLAIGSYVLARSFGLTRRFSLVMTAVLTTNNFIIFFLAGAWLTGLVAWCWFVWAWATLQSYREGGRRRQLIAFIFCAYLAVSSGWPQGLIMLGLLIGGYLVELILEETFRGPRVWRLALSSFSLALMASPMLLPAFLSLGWTNRTFGFFNHGFLSPTVGDLLDASNFFHLPTMRTYNAPAPYTPLLHLAWFLFPLAPLLDGKVVVAALSRRWALGIFGMAGLLLLFGPEQLGPIRYPIRFLPYVQTVLLISFLLVAARPGALVFSKGRMALSLVVIFAGSTWSIFARPEMLALHLLGFCLALALTVVAIGLVQYRAVHLLPCWLIAGVLLGFVITHSYYKSNLELAGPHSKPTNLSPPNPQEKGFNGYTLYAGPNPRAKWRGWPDEFFFAAEGIYQDTPSINGYTPLGHRAYSNRISGDNWTSIQSPQAIAYLFSTNAETGAPIMDLMRVNTLLLEKHSTALWAQPFLDGQWKEVREGFYSVRYEKTNPNLSPTTLSWYSPGIRADAVGAPTGESEQLAVDGGETGGSLVFARLWWPGYRASLDGQPLLVAPLDDLLVKVSVPAQAKGLLTLTFTPPGFRLGLGLAAFGLLLLCCTLFFNHRGNSRAPLSALVTPLN